MHECIVRDKVCMHALLRCCPPGMWFLTIVDFWYVANDECDWECNIWDNQDECQSYDCIWDDNNLQCVDWPYYTDCAEIYDEAYNLGFEEGGSIGAMSGDANGDGTLDILDIVYFIDVILNP